MFVRGIDFTSVLFIRFFDWNLELFHTSVLYPRFSHWNLELFHTSVLYPRFSDWNLELFHTSVPQALASGNFFLPRYYIYYKVRNRSFVKNLEILEYLSLMCNCMKNKKYHTVRTVPNSNRQIVETGQIPIEKSWIQDRGMEQFQIPIGKSWIQDRGME